MSEENKIRRRRVLQGVVCKNKMNKTVVVEVQHRILHPVYKKFISRCVRYKAHDEQNACGTGDRVQIVETRPLSKDKRWRVQRILELYSGDRGAR